MLTRCKNRHIKITRHPILDSSALVDSCWLTGAVYDVDKRIVSLHQDDFAEMLVSAPVRFSAVNDSCRHSHHNVIGDTGEEEIYRTRNFLQYVTFTRTHYVINIILLYNAVRFIHKKLSYRREAARQCACLSRLAN